MGYFIVLAILIIIVVIAFKIFNKDFLSPTVIYTLSMIMAVLCAIIGRISWNNITRLGWNTCIIIVLQVLSFGIGEYILRKFVIKNDEKFKFSGLNDISWWKIVLEIIFVGIVAVLLFFEVKRIAIIAGYTTGSLGVMIGKFREVSTLFTTKIVESGQGINTIVSQLRKICEVICFINIYMLLNNIFSKKIKKLKNLGYIFIIFECFVLSLLTAGRMQMLIYILSGLFMAVVILLSNNSITDIIKKHLWKFAVVAVIAVVGFYIILPLSGRTNNIDFISYMSFYVGTSIPSLEIYLNGELNLLTEPQIFGEETLRGLQTVMFKLKLSDYIQPISKEWLHYNVNDQGVLSSNIFTSAKRYYHDFGYLGVVICQAISGFTFATIYSLMNKKSSKVLLIFYSMYFYMIIDQIRDEHFFANFVHINTIFYFIILCVGLYLLQKFEFKNLKFLKKEKISK